MKTINFNNGIMAKPIDDNFKEVENALKQERLSIGGYGISYGLDSVIDYLTISYKAGHIVDREGYAYTVEETVLKCEAPELEKHSKEYDVLFDGTILLDYVPYSENGVSETNLDNIYVMLNDNRIEIVEMNKKTIKISREYAFFKVNVTYNKALTRIDSVIIEADKLTVVKGMPSESPSIRYQDSGFAISTLKINPLGREVNGVYYAELEKLQEENHLRNIYTNSNNELYLSGTKVKNLGFVHYDKPLNPPPNTLWYNAITHQIFAYLSDGWAAIDNRSMAPVSEYKLYEPDQNPSDLQTFFFKREEDLNMHYVPGQNELKIVIDQYPLFRDQYEEITYGEALQDPILRELLLEHGYTYDQTFNDIGDNEGIGFRLFNPLSKPGYVQAEVVHRVGDSDIHSRLQRSATFCHTGFIELEPEQTDFETSIPYRYGENQLQLMTPSKNLFEHFDYLEVGETRGELTTKVQLSRSFGYNQRIHYRITTNIYSYDHVSSILENIEETAREIIDQLIAEGELS